MRLGALRTAILLGPAAAPVLPELLVILGDGDLGGFAMDAVAATGVLDAGTRERIRAAAEADRWTLTSALKSFGPRAAFLDPMGRAVAVDGSPWNGLHPLAGATADPVAFAAWLDANRDRVDKSALPWAFRELGPAGLRFVLADAAKDGGAEIATFREHVASLGDAAAAPLLAAVREAPAAEAALALRMLSEVLPARASEVAAETICSADPALRATALRSLAAAARAGAPEGPVLAAVRAGLAGADDDAEVRTAAFDALSVLRAVPDDLRDAARRALRDTDPAVRVAACAVVLAQTGDAAAVLPVLRAELNVPHLFWSWGGMGHAPARPEEDYGPQERVWVAASRLLATLGSAGAPAAEDLVWAALRHGDPGMQWRLVAALEPMGTAAASVGPLLLRFDVTDDPWMSLRHGDDPERLAETLRRVRAALGLPEPPDPPWR